MAGKKSRRLNRYYILAGLISLLVIAGYLGGINRVSAGVFFKDIYLGGQTRQEVGATLHAARFTFIGPEGQAVSVPLKEMGIELDYEQIFQYGCQLSSGQPWFQKYFYFLRIEREKVFVPFKYRIDEELLLQNIDLLVYKLSGKPENAYFKVDANGQAELIPERFGYSFNHDDIEQAIRENLAQAHSPLEIITPYAQKNAPRITISSLQEKGIEQLMTSFTTSFDATLETRVHNIRLASSRINNYLLEPGKVFSFNGLIGNATAGKGYKPANIIIGGQLVPGIGGGLCQISSTLYNAALLSNLEIVERHSHQLTVPYIEPGRDATVCYPYKDLSFRNNKDHHILITTEVVDDRLTIRFFGRPLNERVEITTRVLKTFPPPPGRKADSKSGQGTEDEMVGYPGYLVEVWKTVYRGDEKEAEVKLSVDRYSPFEMKKDH